MIIGPAGIGRAAFVVLVGILMVADQRAGGRRWAARTLALVSGLAVVTLLIVCANHLPFAGQLETMESTVLQHAIRAAHGLPVYPAPTPAYVPLAYNPGYYFLAAPFLRLFGETVPVLRFVAILGLLGSALLVYLAVERRTESRWWGLIALGLFAAAYRAMDSALDNAHSDSWMLCLALLGTYLVDRGTSRRTAMLGVLTCALSFWLKQHGALFTIGVVLFLTWRDGVRRSWPYWLIAGVVGPVLYVASVRVPFGPFFHYFTYTVPSGWSEPHVHMVTRLVSFFGHSYPVLALAALAALAVALRAPRARLTVWEAQLPFAILSAVQGALDPGSSNNVFIAAGAWLIIVGTIGIAERLGPAPAPAPPPAPGGVAAAGGGARVAAGGSRTLDWRVLAVAAAFATLLYDPRTEIVSSRAAAAQRDLVQYVEQLGAPVYAPEIGQLPGRPLFSPGASWVALEDMSRGPHRSVAEQQAALTLLDSVLHPSGAAYILTDVPLEQMRPPVQYAHDRYRLAADLGDRFVALRSPPKWFASRFPRLLYRYDSSSVSRGP